jgi:hypothetical protein
MNIPVAIQNTVSQFPGFVVENTTKNGTLWTIRVSREDTLLIFEIDENVGYVCVLERKNIGARGLNRFMNTFVEEVEYVMGSSDDPSGDEGEDPMLPPRD